MAERTLRATGSGTGGPEPRMLPVALAARWRWLPWWARVLLVYALSRLVTTAMMLALASVQGQNPWTGPHPPYGAFANIWDGRWYEIIAYSGYPTEIPLADGVHVAENAWAFMPAYPFLVRALMLVSGLSWEGVAIFVSLVFGLGTALLFHRLLAPRLGSSTALFAVALLCFAPLSPMFQVAYAESMGLFLLALALLLLVRRHYAWLVPVVFVMTLTRPTGLAFALTLALHTLVRYLRRAHEPFPVKQQLGAASVAVFSALMGVAWPALAWAVTGVPNAYTDTELAWRMPYIGYVDLVPFTAWFQGAHWWLGFVGAKEPLQTIAGVIGVLVLIAAFFAALFLPAVRRLGVDLRIWTASYALYLLAVFFPQSSTFRLLMPFFPLLGALAQPRSRLYRAGLILIGILLQWGWLLIAWGVDGYDWSPP
ncbi:hypothetical protein WDJ51_14250 [Rathayibacter sp. YIM 133350]|uniref:hypothetical protein n=1 Tax=Rathayibacter sp. YIM 133350 TaxID=3131992 RepID=UPI00307E1944